MSKYIYISIFFSCFVCLAKAQDSVAADGQEELIVEFSVEGGFYNQNQLLYLYSAEGADIYYTTNGSYPGKYARIYKEPITIDTTTIIRAIARRTKKRSNVISHTYFIREPATSLPVVSISVTASLLFDPGHGLYMKGPDYDGSLSLSADANFLSHKEITGSCEIFESDGHCVFRSYAGLRLFGGHSRFFPQKSLTIVARKHYGEKRIQHRFFGKEGPKKFKFLVLRNSGSDYGRAQFRDLLMAQLARPLDVELQAGRPSHVYINGRYWGLYNIREKINRYFLSAHSEYHKDSIDLLEHRLTRKRGSTRHYRKMLRFLEKHSLEADTAVEQLSQMMEIGNFMDYQIAQIYFDNRDAGGNIRFWRPQTPDGRWRWILYDTDWGFGLHDQDAYQFNTLAFHTEPNGPEWPNPPWSTFILRKLLENDSLRRQFTNRFADHLNAAFSTDHALHWIDSLQQVYTPELPRHWERWRLRSKHWQEHLVRMKRFAQKRPDYLRQHIRSYFEAGNDVPVFIRAEPGGSVRVNKHLDIEKEALRGYYFENIPIYLEAKSKRGYRFSHWEGLSKDLKTSPQIRLLPADYFQLNLRAVFVPQPTPLNGQVVFNEINCLNHSGGDWIEIYNRTAASVTTGGWVLLDKKGNEFELPDRMVGAQQYLIICRDEEAMRSVHTLPDNMISGMSFGLNKNQETLCLYASTGAMIDSISYAIPATDSAFTLSLLKPSLDNSRGENWEWAAGTGTPGSANPYFYEHSIRQRQLIWAKAGAGVSLMLAFVFFFVHRRRVG